MKPVLAKPRLTPVPPGSSRTPYAAGSYIACGECGRLLRIEWAVRSLICSCGARVNTRPLDGPDGR
jgi:hypothetical protein